MTNGWTGGQYSIVRAVLGTYLFVHFVHLTPWAAELFSREGILKDGSSSPLLHLFPNMFALWDGPAFVTTIVALAAGLAILLAVGAWDRAAAALLWYIWACLFGRMPLIGNPGMPYIGWLLLAHVLIPPAPYGSWAARGRADPGTGWRMPSGIFAAAWILMALGYSYSGITKIVSPSWIDGTAFARILENPLARPGAVRELLASLPSGILSAATWGALLLEVAFAPLALVPRLRPWLWSLMLAMHFGLMVVLDFVDLSLGMVMLHLLTFDPSWIPSRRADAVDTVFFDSHCGICHKAVRFLLAEDVRGDTFRFAPLGGETFRQELSSEQIASLPDSLVLLTAEGRILTRSDAIRRALHRLGGLWRVLGWSSAVLPRGLRDRLYDLIARTRMRLGDPPAAGCPVVPAPTRARFSP